MLMEITIGIAIASFAVEMIIVTKVPKARKLLADYDLASLGFSAALSWLMGFVFEAAGLSVMLGALISTLMSWITYRGFHLISMKPKVVTT